MNYLQSAKAINNEIDPLTMLTTKYNETVILNETDSNSVKILCKEPYAQELYDRFVKSGLPINEATKDFKEGQLCIAIAKTINFDEKLIIAEEKYSKARIVIPFRDFSEDPQILINDQDSREFNVIITKLNSGDYQGSEKQTAVLTYIDDLNEYMTSDQWFTVKITSLVRGGYLALYKNTIKCFLPGSHAAANVITNFDEYLGMELPVVIENYDSANDLYIVSYKKYIKKTLPIKIHELEYGKKYTGNMTVKPYSFGIFVELDNYFTGLLHKTEFEDYDDFCKNLSNLNNSIDVYVKDITIKRGEPRILFTDKLEKVNEENLAWQDFKNKIQGKILKYTLDKSDFHIDVEMPDGDSIFTTDVNYLKGKIQIPNDGDVEILRVDLIHKNLKLNFKNV